MDLVNKLSNFYDDIVDKIVAYKLKRHIIKMFAKDISRFCLDNYMMSKELSGDLYLYECLTDRKLLLNKLKVELVSRELTAEERNRARLSFLGILKD